MTFKPGQSGNPHGRKHGSRNRASVMCDQIAENKAPAIVQAMAERAEQGDADCAKVILSRVWQPRRGRAIKFNMPELRTAADVVNAIASISRQVAEATLTPDEGAAICGMIETHRRAIETNDLAARIAALEQRHGD